MRPLPLEVALIVGSTTSRDRVASSPESFIFFVGPPEVVVGFSAATEVAAAPTGSDGVKTTEDEKVDMEEAFLRPLTGLTDENDVGNGPLELAVRPCEGL